MTAEALDRSFFARDAVIVASELVGKVLRVGDLTVRIVETEAYVQLDEASHSFRGPTKRNQIMFGPAGFAYLYFIYGMHWCLNVVTGEVGHGEAVLLRGAIPIDGLDVMRSRRPRCRHDKELLSGPGRLTVALDLSGAQNELDMCNGGVLGFFDTFDSSYTPHTTERIGISKNTKKLWRFISDTP